MSGNVGSSGNTVVNGVQQTFTLHPQIASAKDGQS